MKRLFILLFSLLLCVVSYADTETINWYVDGNTYATTTCQTGGDIILPTTPYKYGYTFQGWANYIPIEYLESTGTQYIDTGVLPDSNSDLEIDFMYPSEYNTQRDSWVCASASNDAEESSFGLTAWEKFAIQYNHYQFINMNCNAGIYYSYKQVKNTYNLNGITGSKQRSVFSTTRPLTIFAYNISDSHLQPPLLTVMRLYKCKIYDNNVLVRDFIPVLDANGTPCMYDKVTQQFFYNQGTGNFIAGPVINQ